jgi:hypothetical protein
MKISYFPYVNIGMREHFSLPSLLFYISTHSLGELIKYKFNNHL